MYYMTYPLNFIHCQQTGHLSTVEIYTYCPAASLEEDAWLLAFFVDRIFQSSDGPEEDRAQQKIRRVIQRYVHARVSHSDECQN